MPAPAPLADSLDPIENVLDAGSAASWVIAEEIGSSDELSTGSDEVVGPLVGAGFQLLDSACAAVWKLLFDQDYCISPPQLGPGIG